MAAKHDASKLGPCEPAETLTIIGASTRAAAQSARRAFLNPISADLFCDLDLQEVATAIAIQDYPLGFESVLAGSQSGGWLYTGGLENYPDLVERWQTIRPLWGNGAEVLREVRNPLRVAECLRSKALPCPAVTLDPTALPRNGTWLKKPLRSAAGMHIERWTGGKCGAIACPETDHYYQEFLLGTSVSAAFLATDRQAVLLGVSEQLLASNSFRYAGSVGPLPLAPEPLAQWNAIGQVLAAEFDLIGLFGVDAVQNEHGIWPVEINPRYTASMEVIERAVEQSFVELHLLACRNCRLPPISTTQNRLAYGKQIYFAERPITLELDLRTEIGDIADVPSISTQFQTEDPVLTVLRHGQTPEEVSQKLASAIADLHQLLKQNEKAAHR